MNIRISNVGPLLSYATAAAFIIFGIYLDSVVDDFFRPIAAYVSAFAALLPELTHRFGPTRPMLTPRALASIQTAWSIQLSLNGIGALGFYLQYQYYDMTLHVLGPLLVCWILSIIIGSYYYVTSQWNLKRIQRLIALIVIFVILLWEVWEWLADQTLGTAMFGQPGEEYDTLYDILVGIVSIIPLYLLNKRYLYRIIVWKHRPPRPSVSTKSAHVF